MGSILSSMSGGNRGRKKKRKHKKYPRKRSTSSSSSSFSSPKGSKHTRHKKLREQEDTSSSSSPFKVNTSTVQDRVTMDQSKFEEACIKAHNEYRRCHNADPLIRDRELSAKAQKWASYLAKKGKLEHSKHSGFGENVAYNSKSNPTGFEICKSWYDEIKDYSFRRPGFAGNTGHFTQVVWKGSTHIGIGVAVGSKGTFAVANYSPAGNITNEGFFDKNVKPQRGTPKIPASEVKKEPEKSSRKDKDSRKKTRRDRSSSSSSSDDDFKNAKTGTTVKTNTEEYVEDGVRKKKTITVTTTITKTSEGIQKSTKTATKIETLPGGSGGTCEKMKNLKVRDSSSSSSSDEDDDDFSRSEKRKFRRQCLDRHNELRQKHKSTRLHESRTLQRAAQKHAKKMLKQRKLFHTPNAKYGENVAMKMPAPTGAQVCDMWYDEIKNYDFRKSTFNGNTGHFTQVVWGGSREIGIGVACKDGRTYVAAYYDPPGNMMGQFEKNVMRPR